MSSVVDQLVARLNELPDAERDQLAASFLDQISADDEADWDPQYVAEIKRRVAEIDAGVGESIDADEFLARLRRRV